MFLLQIITLLSFVIEFRALNTILFAVSLSEEVEDILKKKEIEQWMSILDIQDAKIVFTDIKISPQAIYTVLYNDKHSCCARGFGVSLRNDFAPCMGLFTSSFAEIGVVKDRYRSIPIDRMETKYVDIGIAQSSWETSHVNNMSNGYNKVAVLSGGTINLVPNVIGIIGDTGCCLGFTFCIPSVNKPTGIKIKTCVHLSPYIVCGYKYRRWGGYNYNNKDLLSQELVFLLNQDQHIEAYYLDNRHKELIITSNNITVQNKRNPLWGPSDALVLNTGSNIVSRVKLGEKIYDYLLISSFFYYGIGLHIFHGQYKGWCYTWSISCIWQSFFWGASDIMLFLYSKGIRKPLYNIKSAKDSTPKRQFVDISKDVIFLNKTVDIESCVPNLSVKHIYQTCIPSIDGWFNFYWAHKSKYMIGVCVKFNIINKGIAKEFLSLNKAIFKETTIHCGLMARIEI